MKTPIIITLLIIFSISTSYAQSVSSTYSVGDIPTGDIAYDPTCNGPSTTLVVNIPVGANILSIDVAYDMTAAGGGYMSEQRSQIFCQETALDEGGYTNGAGTTGGTFSYNRTGLTLANGVSATGVLTFEMRAYRTWTGTAGCNVAVSKVDNNTWTITVNYVNPIPMVYDSNTVTQNNITEVPVCSANQDIIGLEVVMDGGLNLIDITELQIEMTGTTNLTDVANIDIFYTGTNSTFSPINLFASAVPAAGTITLNGVQTLAPGVNYFWIAYDVSPTPPIGNLLDAQCTQFTIDGVIYTPTVTDPVGNRVIGPCAGTPGGVPTNLTLWLDGTDGANSGGLAATNGSNVDTWINRQANASCPDLNQTTAAMTPIYKENTLNFNPVVSFDGANDQLSRNVLGSDVFSTTNNTIFFVHKLYSGVVYFKWEQGSSGNRVGYENSGGFTRFDFPSDAAGNQTIGTFAYDTLGQIVTATTDASNSVLRNMGLQNTSNPISGTLNNTFTSSLSIGENVSFSLPAKIDFAEVIIYNETLSAIQQNKVESYLAIKYGMTLGINGTSLDYNSSAGNIIWDATANTGYNFDIGGISRDDLSDQDQRKSKSINQNLGVDRDILTVANGTNFNAPTMSTSDLSHFIWGNNDAPLNMNDTTTFPTLNAGMLNTLLDRHWKGQESGAVDTVTLQFDMTTVTGFSAWSSLKLLVDTDSNFTTGATSISPSIIDSTGALTIAFEHNFSSTEGFYFTLATTTALSINNPPAVVACDSFTLAPITGAALVNPQYYSATGGAAGIGVVIPVGTTIFNSTIIYLYDETGGVPNQFDEDTLNITINMTQTSIDTQIACDTYTWIDGITYTSSNNIATQTLTASNGCDSIVTLNLTINNSNGSIDTQIACNTFTWIDGNTYFTSNNTATQTFTNAIGCDSIVTLDLTINNSTSGTDTQAACGSFTWIDGIVYTTSNSIATHTITGGSANGCDSILTLNLTIFPLLTIDLGEDQFVCDESILLSAGGNFSSYLWSNNSNDSTLLVTEPGVYSVTVTDINNCSVSDNITLIEDCPSSFWVPNVFSPNGDNQNDVFNVILENSQNYSMRIYNRWGNLIFESNTVDVGWDGKDASEGTYFYVIEYSYNKQGSLTSETVKGTITLLK